MPRPTMDMGRRATKPVAEKSRAPGSASTRRYGESIIEKPRFGHRREPNRRHPYDGGMQPDPTPYDALLLVSFGGPEKPDDVVPFLENVTRGRGIPRERLAEVGEHYFQFGG